MFETTNQIENQLTLWGVFLTWFPSLILKGWSYLPDSWSIPLAENPTKKPAFLYWDDPCQGYTKFIFTFLFDISIYTTCIPMRFPWHSHSTIPVIPAPPNGGIDLDRDPGNVSSGGVNPSEQYLLGWLFPIQKWLGHILELMIFPIQIYICLLYFPIYGKIYKVPNNKQGT